jgi:tetratricopeptide (TPR) repeat protein
VSHAVKRPRCLATASRALGLVLVLGAASPVAHAAEDGQPPAAAPAAPKEDQAMRLFQQGRAHYALGEYQQAIAAFKEAYGLSPDPLLIFNIGQAYRKMGECRRALETFRRFLQLDPESDRRADAERYARELEGECPPAAPGGSPPASTPSAAALAAGAPPVKEASPPVGGLAQSTAAPAPAAAAERGARRRLAIWTLGGGLALGAGAASLAAWNQPRFGRWERAHDAILADAAMPGASIDDLVKRQNTNDDLLRSVRRADHWSIGLGVAAGVAAAAALGLLLWP